MSSWKLKASVQKSISYLPNGKEVNHVFQKYITKGVELSDEYFYDRLNHASDHIKAYQKYFDISCLEYSLELGTGWYPIVPIALFLCGVSDIYTLDIDQLTHRENFKKTIQKFVDLKKFNTLGSFIPYRADKIRFLEALNENYEELSYEKILNLLNIHIIIGDARKIPLKENAIQLIHSNNTFEHIYPDILKQILKEFNRLIHKSHGVMSHFIDMSDHFAHFDTSITIYNFLKFSDSQWRAIDNSIQPQNRLRFSDYKNLYNALEIPITYTESRPGSLLELKSIKLNKIFNDKSLEEIAISHGRIESLYQ